MKEKLAKLTIELMKASMKPGYLYGVKDGELYCVEANIPERGKTVTQSFRMPERFEDEH